MAAPQNPKPILLSDRLDFLKLTWFWLLTEGCIHITCGLLIAHWIQENLLSRAAYLLLLEVVYILTFEVVFAKKRNHHIHRRIKSIDPEWNPLKNRLPTIALLYSPYFYLFFIISLYITPPNFLRGKIGRIPKIVKTVVNFLPFIVILALMGSMLFQKLGSSERFYNAGSQITYGFSGPSSHYIIQIAENADGLIRLKDMHQKDITQLLLKSRNTCRVPPIHITLLNFSVAKSIEESKAGAEKNILFLSKMAQIYEDCPKNMYTPRDWNPIWAFSSSSRIEGVLIMVVDFILQIKLINMISKAVTQLTQKTKEKYELTEQQQKEITKILKSKIFLQKENIQNSFLLRLF